MAQFETYNHKVYLDKCMDEMIKAREERKRKQHLDAMLSEWRKDNGYCPHCGEKL